MARGFFANNGDKGKGTCYNRNRNMSNEREWSADKMKITETKADNYRMNRAEKKEFYRELFSLAVPIGLQSLLVALIGATDALMLGRFSQDAAGFRWFSAEINKDILKITWPMLGSALAWGLSISMHSFIMGHLGSDATAAASITSVAQEIVTCVCKGIATGSGIMVGKLLGQEMFEKAKAYGRKFWQVSFVVGGIHMFLLAGLGPVVTRYFILTETARQYLVIMLIFTGLYVLAYSFNTVLTCGILPAGGDAKYDAVSVFIAS